MTSIQRGESKDRWKKFGEEEKKVYIILKKTVRNIFMDTPILSEISVDTDTPFVICSFIQLSRFPSSIPLPARPSLYYFLHQPGLFAIPKQTISTYFYLENSLP